MPNNLLIEITLKVYGDISKPIVKVKTENFTQEEEWPEGDFDDNPEEELPEVRREREMLKDRNFFG